MLSYTKGCDILSEKVKGKINQNFKLEIFNSTTHFAGVILGVIFLLLLIIPKIKAGDVLGTVAFSIYGGCFIFMFLMSSIYHIVQPEKPKKILRVFDHISIYYFIAGTFTPVILLLTEGTFRIAFITVIWVIAALGTIYKLATIKYYDKLKGLSVIIYVAMGWLAVFLINPMITNASWKFLALIVLGGVLYSGGTIFYKWDKLKYHHVIWHLFVLAAAIIHFLAFYLYI